MKKLIGGLVVVSALFLGCDKKAEEAPVAPVETPAPVAAPVETPAPVEATVEVNVTVDTPAPVPAAN